jgi:CHASE1-domain containing sensor protein
MEYILIIPLAGVIMGLLSTVVMAFCASLEDEHKKTLLRRYARRQIMMEMELEKQRAFKPEETIDLLSHYRD